MFTRYIDDLGRIHIPKNVRDRLRIHPGDSVEMLIDDESIIIKKHLILADCWISEASKVAEAIANELHLGVAICNLDRVVAISGLSRQLMYEKVYEDIACRTEPYNSLSIGGDLHPIEGRSLVARYVQPIQYAEKPAGAIIEIGRAHV